MDPIPARPAPPASPEEALLWLRLIRSARVGPATFHRLLAEHGHAAAALAALPDMARAAGVADYAPCPDAAARAEARAGRAAGARLLAFGGPGYPAALMDLPDAPPILWALGDTALADRPAVALVGARGASSLGLRMAGALARGLGDRGFTVVSGLARGIDAAAHDAALPTGTVAVVAGGVDRPYPPENADLHARIAAQGLILSEQPMGLDPQARHFPRRNRLVAGLARAVVVVEAAARSGSLGTARLALDQGREVMAVPGHPMDARAAGCNMLIRDGAVLVRGAADVLSALGADPDVTGAGPAQDPPLASRRQADPPGPAPSPPVPAPDRGTASDARAPAPKAVAARILGLLGPAPVAEDQLIRDLGLPPARVSQDLLALELEGRVERRPGGLLALTV